MRCAPLALSAVLFLHLPLRAAEAESPPPPATDETPPPATGEEEHVVVVTATRLPARLEETGTVLTVADEAWIRGQGSSEAQDVLRQMPGLAVARLGQPGAPTNLYLRGGESDHTLVLMDGFQVNQDGGDFDWDDVGTGGLGRVVLMRGAASALYGSDAMTGVVSLETARGEGKPRAVLSMEAGNLHATRERAQVLGEEGGTAYNVSFERYDRTGSRRVNGDWRRSDFVGRFDLAPRASTAIKLVARKGASEFGTTGLDEEETDPNESNDDESSLLGVEWNERWAEGLSTTLKTWRWDEERAFDDPANEDETDLVRTRTQFARTGLDLQTTWAAPEDVPFRPSFALGGAWQGEDYDWTSTYRDEDPVFPYESTNAIDRSRGTRALYWTARATFFERLDLEGGQRYEDHSTFGNATTGRAAASLRVEETGSRLHASYGTGFKEPTFFENYTPEATFTMPGATYITTGNTGLDPERSETWDAGFEQRFLDGRVRVDVTYFHVRFRDFITFRSVETAPAVFTSTFLNGDAAVSRGWELSGEVRPLDKLAIRGQLTNLETEAEAEEDAPPNFVDGKELLRRPERRWSLAASYEPVEGVTLFASVAAIGDFADGDWATGERVRVDGYTRVDVAASWEFLEGWRLFGRIENLFDEKGYEAFDYPIEPASGAIGLEATLEF